MKPTGLSHGDREDGDFKIGQKEAHNNSGSNRELLWAANSNTNMKYPNYCLSVTVALATWVFLSIMWALRLHQ